MQIIYLHPCMKLIREHIIFRFFWLVMALHILNFSVDTPDLHPNYVPEDLSYNDMESVVEILLEEVLEINNAIAEHDENDTDDGSGGLTVKKSIDVSHYNNTIKVLVIGELPFICRFNIFEDAFLSQFHPELIPPPPKA